MNTVTPQTAYTLTISATEITANQEERRRQLKLPADKAVRAIVLEGGRNKIVLELDHRRFVAETRVPLQAGQKLNLQVVSVSPKLVLKIIEDPLRSRISQAIHLLNFQGDIFSTLQQLQEGHKSIFDGLSKGARQALQVWDSLPHDMLGDRSRNKLWLLARQLGLDLESRLARGEKSAASLKSALLELAGKLDSDGDMAERVGQLLQQLELYQLLQLRFSQNNIYILPLPFPFLEQGYMLTEKGKEEGGKGKDAPTKISLHLSLQKLGHLRIDFLHDSQGLHLRFACDSRKKADYLAGFQKELRKTLTAVVLQGVSYTADAEEPAKFLIKKLLSTGDTVLDARV